MLGHGPLLSGLGRPRDGPERHQTSPGGWVRLHSVLARLGRGPAPGAHAGTRQAGADPTEVAERAGNSVEVLLSRYAKCLDVRQDVADRRIAELLGEGDDQEEINN